VTNNSIPPQDKAGLAKISIIAHRLIDGLAIISTVVLILFNKLDATVGIPIIALIAGVWLNSSKDKEGPGNGPSVILAAVTGFARFWGVHI
jgi:hypothetical protein